MRKGKDWDLFLQNSENKTERIRKTDSVRSKLNIPLTVTEGENTWLITKIKNLQSHNHHEADTRLVLHERQSTAPIVIRATDTDVFILLSYGCNGCKPLHDWMLVLV